MIRYQKWILVPKMILVNIYANISLPMNINFENLHIR